MISARRSQTQPTAKNVIQDPANHKFVGVASCWDIAIKAGRRKLGLTERSGVLLGRELPRNGFDLLPIELRHATHVEILPEHHKDPFSRVLIAQSLLEMVPLVNIDVQLDAYGITRIW